MGLTVLDFLSRLTDLNELSADTFGSICMNLRILRLEKRDLGGSLSVSFCLRLRHKLSWEAWVGKPLDIPAPRETRKSNYGEKKGGKKERENGPS